MCVAAFYFNDVVVREEWKILVRTSCEAMAPPYCRGRQGFQVASDGRFVAGPSANGLLIDDA